MLSNIRIVMVNTSHSGNIGAAARAMKNMGLTQLYLVQPNDFPSLEASARASHAVDVVNNSVVTDTLQQAVADCSMVIGTSARERTMQWQVQNPRSCANEVIQAALTEKVALVFGRERTGLTNEELEICHKLVHIPTDPDYSSLNVASAIQIMAYEIYSHQTAEQAVTLPILKGDDRLATSEQLNVFQQHLEQVMGQVEFYGSNNPEVVNRRLRLFFNRAAASRRELNILHGILSAMQKMTGLK